MAVESSFVTADIIEANEFPDLAEAYQVSGVPKTIINDVAAVMGARREADFVAAALAVAMNPPPATDPDPGLA